MTKKSYLQTEHFTTKGHWWLPNTNKKVAGELSYTEGDLTLSLYGGLSEATVESPFSAKPDELEYSLIHGELEDNTAITVLKPFYTKWKPDITTLAVRPGSKVELRSSQLGCGAIVEGAHLCSSDETFSKCRVEIPCLDIWLGVSPFNIDMKDLPRSISLDYSIPEDEQYKIESSDCRVSFTHAVTPPGLPLGSSPVISHHTYLEIDLLQPQTFYQILSRSSDVVDLLSVVYGGPLMPSRTMLYRPSYDEPLSVFYPRHEVESKSYDTHDFLIRYIEIKDSFPTVLRNWMNSTDNIKRASRMLISSERRPSNFIEFRFLPLVQAVEVLSNEAAHVTVIEEEEFKIIRENMLESVKNEISKELTNSIKNSLQWANGRSLRDKLRSFLGELQDDTWQLFAVDKEMFLAGVVKTRNHYTHYSTKARGRILQGRELHWGIQKLALMIRILLLVRAGVPEKVLQSAIREHFRLKQERSVWAGISEDGSEYVGYEQQ
ncbi:HEPN domain-containing protein [Gimesia sp.]|uniref:ApeA N-terminal domain 1-containing protein n=1 Tax=Gimesia sp. TaxID=2024833 RepID=UPI003A9103B1